MKKWFKRLKNQAGMTLVELLAVVVILGIVAAIAVPAIGNIIENSKKDAHGSNALLIINSVKLGVVSGQLTSADDDAPAAGLQFHLSTLVDEGLLDSIPADPSNTDAYDATSFVTYTKSASGAATYTITLTNGSHTYYNAQSETAINNGTATLTMPNN